MSAATPAAAPAEAGVHPDDVPPFPELHPSSLAIQALMWSQLRVPAGDGNELKMAPAAILHAWSQRLRARGETERADRLRAVAARIADDPHGDSWCSLYRHFSGADSAIPASDLDAIQRELDVVDVGRPAHAVGSEGEENPADCEDAEALVAALPPEFFAQQQRGPPVLTHEQSMELHALCAGSTKR